MLEKHSAIVSPEIVLDLVKDDPDDDRVLECAVAGGATYIVTGDRHLLKLGRCQGVAILTVRQFMDSFLI